MMTLLSSALLALYFSSLLSFSFITHPVGYCFLLLLSAFSVSGYVYMLSGFSWYLVLFCLVYIGGVYVLFIFVSLHNPNPFPVFGSNLELFFFIYFFFISLFISFSFKIGSGYVDYSHYLCSYFEGFSYCLFCLVLMLGFVVVSVVSGDKDSFFR
uniref:NADH dehydrogenase subunit 6 n=1 Tax=Cryptocotyle lingua TaxID=66766 RepID=UPI0020299153|nr:NADH dehydrogenase subunit 6 [Cryptocotyle lingua]UQU69053.1 NADH dehydrogenase subunit 6 [Cryptocotyle lingua]